MIIQCTHCKARFKISDDKASKEEIKARCAKCEQIFIARMGVNAFPGDEISRAGNGGEAEPKIDRNQPQIPLVKKQGSGPEESSDAPMFNEGELGIKEQPEQKQESSLQDIVMGQDAGSQAEDLPDPDTQQKVDPSIESPIEKVEEQKEEDEKHEESALSETQALEKSPGSEDSNSVAVAKIKLKKVPAISRKTSVRRREYDPPKYLLGLYPAVLIVATLIGLVAAGIPFPFKKIGLLFGHHPGITSKSINISDISSDNVRSVSGNDYFVINGVVFNNSGEEIKDLTMEAELYSNNNRFIVKKRFPCCVNLDRTAIYEIGGPQDIEDLFKKELLKAPRKDASEPFTLLFKKPDETIESFRINILNE